MQQVLKRTPFGLQKDSFRSAKGLLLEGKRTRFERQKEYIWKGRIKTRGCALYISCVET